MNFLFTIEQGAEKSSWLIPDQVLSWNLVSVDKQEELADFCRDDLLNQLSIEMLIPVRKFSFCAHSEPSVRVRPHFRIWLRRFVLMVSFLACCPLFAQEGDPSSSPGKKTPVNDSQQEDDSKSSSELENQPQDEKAEAEKPDKPAESVGEDSKTIESNKRKTKPKGKPIEGLTFSDSVTSRYKVGVKIRASAAVQNIYLAIPVPRDWPEQIVTVDSEEMPAAVGNVSFMETEGGIRRQIIKIPHLKSDEEIEITSIFRIESFQINLSPEARGFLRPKTSHKDGKAYLNPTPHISFIDTKLRNQVKELTKDKSDVWSEVESLFDWVRENVDQKEMPNTDSVRAFRKKEGSEEDRIALFIAFCRCHKIPARTVWVDGSSYAEFMLVDVHENSCWFPCNIAGVREFGFISEPRVILQKGENIKIPEKAERQRFVAEHMRGEVPKGAAQPTVRFVRELLPAN